ncbi:NAD(P)H-dependent glycerol-3-phosphate dehydrogenase [Sulfuricystis multivorans]|uniref:NAD(P)H-dependent glycerol-3-phosphate dehydrogenase n=1 Tax=Sulfuricystis multivorans TaxID=2211108 RepID=UPI000F831B49|nr:NAD(P)H-dependent glycerol-3-phosphate dehydrogenase [Sulfuricystis multivorans]
MHIAILGAGAWGTALALSFAQRHSVSLWTWRPDHAAAMNAARENTRYLPGFPFPETLNVGADFNAAVACADLAVIATPIAGLREAAARLASARPDLPFLWVCKGLEAGTGLLPHQVVAAVAAPARCGALSGPSFAAEVARNLPTAVTLAASDGAFAEHAAQALNGPRLRIYANDDLIGVEVGGAVKNVIAIATGICDGLGLGLNARAALMTRGLAEITRFGVALGARAETFMGLSGLGDLILTCTGDLSRNRRLGLALAAGRPLPQIQHELGHVAEGVHTAHEVARRARALGVEMPITATVCDVLDGHLSAAGAVERLMRRDPKHE